MKLFNPNFSSKFCPHHCFCHISVNVNICLFFVILTHCVSSINCAALKSCKSSLKTQISKEQVIVLILTISLWTPGVINLCLCLRPKSVKFKTCFLRFLLSFMRLKMHKKVKLSTSKLNIVTPGFYWRVLSISWCEWYGCWCIDRVLCSKVKVFDIINDF